MSYSQDKAVHLVHGLGGDEDSWSKFSDELESDCNGLETTTFFNPSNAGLDFYTQGLKKDFEDRGVNPDDVAIGHSFGGLNLRNIDSEGYFGAYMTVASVHDGSPLTDAKLDGSFDAWIFNTCKEVFTQPVAAIQEISFINIAQDLFNGYFEDMFCNKVNDLLTDHADAFLGGGQSVQDLIDDGYVANLPAASIPGIGIVCTTEGHPLWSLLDDGGFINIPFGGTFNGVAKKIENTGKASSRLLKMIANITFAPWVKSKLLTASRECKESYLWMQSTESAWNELIGAGGGVNYTTTTSETWICNCVDVQTGNPVPCDNLEFEIELLPGGADLSQTCSDNPDCWSYVSSTVVSFGPDLPSDGLVPLNRQSLPGALNEITINNASHFKQPKDSGVHSAILANISSSLAINSAFKIPSCP